MRGIAILAFLLVHLALPAWAGDSSPHDAVIKELLANVAKLTETLSTVKDEETATAALPALRQRAKEWDAIRKKAEDLPPPSAADRDTLAKKYAKPLEEAQKKLLIVVLRVRLVPGGRKALQEISAVLRGQKLPPQKKDK